jgi:uncharacterized membrane protein
LEEFANAHCEDIGTKFKERAGILKFLYITQNNIMILETLRLILGLILVLFIPGFAILLAVYPKKKQISLEERIVLSLALSMGIVPLVTYFLNIFLKVPITETNSLLMIIAIVGIAIFCWFRKKYKK